jgi:hypothetical protein
VTAPAPTRPNRALVAAAVVFVLLAVVPGAMSLIAQGYRSTTERSAALASDVSVLTVRNIVGDVQLVPSLDDLVHVRTKAEHGLQPPELTEESTAGGVLLAASCEDALAIECQVDYEIEVPRDFAVRLDVGSGDVAVHGLSGELTVTGGSGDVVLSAMSGPVTVRGDYGDVLARGIDSDAVTVERTHGNVSVDLVTAPGSVRVHADDGDVRVGVPGTARYRVDSWALDGETRIVVRTDRASEHAITATSGSGDVVVGPAEPVLRPVVPSDAEALQRGDGDFPVVPDLPDAPDLPDLPDVPDVPDAPEPDRVSGG